MEYSLIVAVDRNWLIGKNNKLPWYIYEDLQHFKKVTTDNIVVMGRKTFESLGKPLPSRRNIVISSTMQSNDEEVRVYENFPDMFAYVNNQKEQECFFIGGSNIYREALKYVNTLYITHIDMLYVGDTYFPHFDESEWELVEETKFEQGKLFPFPFKFCKYKRI